MIIKLKHNIKTMDKFGYPTHKTQLLKIHHTCRFWLSQMHTKQF